MDKRKGFEHLSESDKSIYSDALRITFLYMLFLRYGKADHIDIEIDINHAFLEIKNKVNNEIIPLTDFKQKQMQYVRSILIKLIALNKSNVDLFSRLVSLCNNGNFVELSEILEEDIKIYPIEVGIIPSYEEDSDFISEDDRYCPACQERPCACSDPFQTGSIFF